MAADRHDLTVHYHHLFPRWLIKAHRLHNRKSIAQAPSYTHCRNGDHLEKRQSLTTRLNRRESSLHSVDTIDSRFHVNHCLFMWLSVALCLAASDPRHHSHFPHLFLQLWSWPVGFEGFIKSTQEVDKTKSSTSLLKLLRSWALTWGSSAQWDCQIPWQAVLWRASLLTGNMWDVICLVSFGLIFLFPITYGFQPAKSHFEVKKSSGVSEQTEGNDIKL